MSKKKALSFNQYMKGFSAEKSRQEYLYQLKWPYGHVYRGLTRHVYEIR